jgi:dimethylhistidine N-methyltransferase
MSQVLHHIDSDYTAAASRRQEAFALDILVGLSEWRKAIPSVYHYDKEGSRLFEEIMSLDEYYLTRCEIDTLKQNSGRIASYLASEPFNVVEFGPGNGAKTKIIIDELLRKDVEFRYLPIDISESALDGLAADFEKRYPLMELHGLVTEYFSGVKWLNHRYDRRNIVLFLGSNIGNLDHRQARLFLRELWVALNDGDIVVIGFDLKKDIDLLLWAYNDNKGVTAKFNLNVLERINRELGGEFDISKFRHFGTYDVFSGAMESYLVSLEEQEVFIEGIERSFTFRAWEPIHLEYSYKYLESDIETLAGETGFVVRENMYDSKKYFADSVWEVRKDDGNGH